ncbi:hypothetical protein GCM10022232_14860 [Streptomyces plumbiresistens]|uniref:Uncharacterized protein n=1 Tax=Streptomyces plumbiresistens TaxID=511811 RepID=A0ABP7QJ16_9ACTN
MFFTGAVVPEARDLSRLPQPVGHAVAASAGIAVRVQAALMRTAAAHAVLLRLMMSPETLMCLLSGETSDLDERLHYSP